MGVTFHALTSVSIAATIAAQTKNPLDGMHLKGHGVFLLIILCVCILSHGILDVLPHQYPLPASVDVVMSLIGITGVAFCTKKDRRFLLLFCFLGCLLPDVIDLTFPILNRKLGMAFPTYRIFPWHWPAYSGSIFDGRRLFESTCYHSVVVSLCLLIVYVYRHELFGEFGIWRCYKFFKRSE